MNSNMDFNKICRVCLNEGTMMSIFKVSVSKKIMACAEVQVWQNDGLPAQICNKCSANLHISFQFKRLCEKSDAKLRQIKNDSNITTQTNCEKSSSKEPQIILTNQVEQSQVPQAQPSCIYLECTPLIEVENPSNGKFTNNFATTIATIPTQTTNYNYGLQPQTVHTVVGYNMQGYSQNSGIYSMPVSANGNLQSTNAITIISEPAPLVLDTLEEPACATDNKTDPKEASREETKSFQCTICNKTFANAAKLSRHAKTHSKDMPYKCKVCNKSFPHSGNYKIHLRMHTDERPYRCNVCNKGCRQAQDLEKHMRTHTGERPHKCNLCPRAFSTSSNLIAHIRTHTGERPYVCCVCQKAFCQSNELTKHMRTHTGEKSHVCDICHKGFNGSSTLIVHKRSHTGEKPYVCKVCNKAFSQSGCLVVHLKRHNGEKKFTCSFCMKQFLTNASLKEHLLAHSTSENKLVCFKQFGDAGLEQS